MPTALEQCMVPMVATILGPPQKQGEYSMPHHGPHISRNEETFSGPASDRALEGMKWHKVDCESLQGRLFSEVIVIVHKSLVVHTVFTRQMVHKTFLMSYK